MENCSCNVDVSGSEYLGGITGFIYDSTLRNSYYNYEDVLINGEHCQTFGAMNSEMYALWIANGLELDIDNYLENEGENYLISNVGDLEMISVFGQEPDLSFILTDDIDLAGEEDLYIPYFSGSFNGNGHVISNLTNSRGLEFTAFFGIANDAEIENLGLPNANLSGLSYTGGFAGLDQGSNFTDCWCSGNIEATGMYIGGFTGKSAGSVIDCCYFSGIITAGTGSTEIGGFSGNLDSIYGVRNCFSRGQIICDESASRVGGFTGYFSSYNNLDKSYSAVSIPVTGETIGGFSGFGSGYYITNSFWDIDISGQADSNSATGKTTAEMTDVATYTSLATEGLTEAWDFTDNPFDDTASFDIWTISCDVNNGYPYLTATGFVPVSVEEIPATGNIIGNYPNPFNPQTTIFLNLKEDSEAVLKIYNIKGQSVETIFQGHLEAGEHKFIWNAADCSSGIYFLKYASQDEKKVKKLILLK